MVIKVVYHQSNSHKLSSHNQPLHENLIWINHFVKKSIVEEVNSFSAVTLI